MKKLLFLFSALILGTSGIMASATADDKVAPRNAYRYDNSFIFVEDGITFSVYPDGEFDFYIDNQVTGRRNNVTFNSGFDYSPFAQYDDYGAVIQVENTPIYYDYNGRVTQVGDVNINYNRGRVRSVGGMHVFYNRSGFYDYHTGYINTYNRFYTYRPFHSFFARPALGFCLVFNNSYRRFYNPFRYTYYSPYRFNNRRAYATFGKTHRYNKVRKQRASVYRNDRRVAVRDNRRTATARSNRTTARSNRNAVRSNANKGRKNISTRRNTVGRNNRSTVSRNASTRSGRSNSKIAGRTAVDRTKRIETKNYRKATQRTSTRAPRQRTVTKRSVTRTPRTKTVTRSTKQVRRPQSRTANRTVRQTTSRSRNTTARSNSSRSRNTSARSNSSRRTVSKAPARTSRSSTSRSVRSSRRQ